MSHWVEQIRQYGDLQQYCADRHDQAHKTNLKDGWNASNHNLNSLPQVITFQRRILCFEIREFNLQALAQRRGNSAATCKVLPSGADLAAPLSSQSYAKPEFMGPQNRRDGKHPDAMIKDFRALLKNMQHSTHRVTIYNCTRECLNLRVVTRRIYRMNNFTQWSCVFTMVLRFKLRALKVNAYLRFVDAQEARAGAEGTDGTTGCG